MNQDTIQIQPAKKEQATDLAYLINLAGEGLPHWVWQQMAAPGESVEAVGAARASRESGGFSYRNACVIANDQRVCAMLLGYVLVPDESLNVSEVPAPIKPLLELEALAPESWYVNALATLPQEQGKGFGRRLLRHAENLGEQKRCKSMSIIVAAENQRAKKLYLSEGYRVIDSRPIVPFVGCALKGDWALMIKPL